MSEVQTTAPAIDIEQRVAQYIKLRDKVDEIKKRHVEELKPYAEARQQLDGLLISHMQAINVASMRTGAGTITTTTKTSATVNDGDAFREHVKTMGDWDLADIRANAPAVMAYLEEHGALPPGVHVSSMLALSVRRAS